MLKLPKKRQKGEPKAIFRWGLILSGMFSQYKLISEPKETIYAILTNPPLCSGIQSKAFTADGCQAST